MGDGRQIKALVVDDSIVYREAISRGLSRDPLLKVVATAKDAFDARDKILEYEPDVMTCDLEMPKMNGIEFIRRLLPQYPLPVVVVSTRNDAVFDAMNAGAVDFVGKPDGKTAKSKEKFFDELVAKVKVASGANVRQEKKGRALQRITSNVGENDERIIAIGASTGGVEALYNLLKQLPGNVPGMVIVQHIPSGFSDMFAQRLDATTNFSVKEAVSGDQVRQGKVLIAPGDQQMRVKKMGGVYQVECFHGEKVSGHRPSVDVLFKSVAKVAGKDAFGVILTGMGSDGAKGLLAMRQEGARTLGQDEESSVVYGMPRVAYEIGAVERQASLENIPKLLYAMLV